MVAVSWYHIPRVFTDKRNTCTHQNTRANTHRHECQLLVWPGPPWLARCDHFSFSEHRTVHTFWENVVCHGGLSLKKRAWCPSDISRLFAYHTYEQLWHWSNYHLASYGFIGSIVCLTFWWTARLQVITKCTFFMLTEQIFDLKTSWQHYLRLKLALLCFLSATQGMRSTLRFRQNHALHDV